MQIKDYKCKCGHNDFFFGDKGNQKGIYCSYCGKWFKWVDKDEQNLALKPENDTDKLRAEIKGMYRVILKGTPKDDWVVRWNDCLDEVLEIVDKYRIEPVLDSIRNELIQSIQNGVIKIESGKEALFNIIDKHRENENT